MHQGKKVSSCCEGFCGHTQLTILIGLFVEQVNREEKSHADWTNQHVVEQINREEKKNKSISFQSTISLLLNHATMELM